MIDATTTVKEGVVGPLAWCPSGAAALCENMSH